MLVRSAFSANIKERRDCSTALFDAQGRMIVQAEHIPVHLGAMPEAVAAVRARDPAPGELYVLNDPYTGGTHLPDITIVSRVAVRVRGLARAPRGRGRDGAGQPAGRVPELYQEGVIVPPVRLGDEVLTLLLANMRNPDERRGDLRAQVAAHQLAERRLGELVERRGERGGHGRDGRALPLFGAGRPGRARRPAGRPVRGRRRSRAADRLARDPRRGDDLGRRGGDRLRGHVAAARRQPQLPAGGHALGVLLRRALPDRA